jgi:glycosyltransferase involved in cell wall biosynthesis
MKLSSNIAAIMPAYNEEKNIQEVVEKCKKFTDNIIVINDGSIDNTQKIAEKMNITLINHETNLGKGEAIKTATHYILENMKEIEYVVIVDTDMQYNPEDSEKLLDPIKNNEADFVMGYRNWKEVPIHHRIGNHVWRIFFNTLFKTKLKDVSCGFVAMNKKALESIDDIYGGYIIESSMLIQCIIKNLRIKQVPVSVKYLVSSDLVKGIRMAIGVLMFILKKGFEYRSK